MTQESTYLKCNYFEKKLCRSCSFINEDGIVSLNLPSLPDFLSKNSKIIHPWVRVKSPFFTRAKARMVASGEVEKPILGILDEELRGVELLSCPLHKKLINEAISLIPELITHAKLEPYKIKEKTGLLKNIIFQTNHEESHLRVRFVLADISGIDSCLKIIKSLENKIHIKLSSSVNIQPIPHQIPEGDEEVHLSGEQYLWENYGDFELAFPAKSFMQVTPEIALKLYEKASIFAKDKNFNFILDLFSGAGGFSLSVGKYAKRVLGVEISKDALSASLMSAQLAGLNNIEFKYYDLIKEQISFNEAIPDMIICNPPRRGLGSKIIELIKRVKPEYILYSSCNSTSFISDFNELSSFYSIEEVTPFEMFPLTNHYELLAVLRRIV